MLARRMRWTWQQLRSQPKQFIDILLLMEKLDSDKQQAEQAEADRKARMARAKAKGKHR
jgi:hypothetical protein